MTNDGQPKVTVAGYVTGVDKVKKQFTMHMVQKVLVSEIATHINVVGCMDCSAHTQHGKGEVPKIGNFVSFTGSVLFFKDDVMFMHVNNVSHVITF